MKPPSTVNFFILLPCKIVCLLSSIAAHDKYRRRFEPSSIHGTDLLHMTSHVQSAPLWEPNEGNEACVLGYTSILIVAPMRCLCLTLKMAFFECGCLEEVHFNNVFERVG